MPTRLDSLHNSKLSSHKNVNENDLVTFQVCKDIAMPIKVNLF